MKLRHLHFFVLNVMCLHWCVNAYVYPPNTCLNLTLPKPPLLPINCLQYNISGYQCSNYIGIYLYNYAGMSQTPSQMYSVPTQGYSPSVLPQDTLFFPVEYFNANPKLASNAGLPSNISSTTLQIYLILQFDKIFGIDDVPSTMKVSTILTIGWMDSRISWNASLTPLSYDYCNQVYNVHQSGVLESQTVRLSTDFIWTPVVTLINSASDDANMLNNMVGRDRISIYPNGMKSWQLKGNVETYCNLDLTWYPFDKQTCTLMFSSREAFILDGFNFSIATSVKGAGIFYNDDNNYDFFATGFQDSLSWTTKSVTVERKEAILVGTKFQNMQSLIVYTLTLQRNSKVYYTTAIVPSIMVTILTLSSLWVTDYGTRLGLTITAMLTIMAILWSVSASLPATKVTTWMDYFTMLGIFVIALVILETAVVYNLSAKKKTPPQWCMLKLYVQMCSWNHIFHYICCCFLCKSKSKPKSTYATETYFPDENGSMDRIPSRSMSSTTALHMNIDLSAAADNAGNNKNKSSFNQLNDRDESTWAKLCVAIDMCGQFTFTLMYFVTLIVLLGQAHQQQQS